MTNFCNMALEGVVEFSAVRSPAFMTGTVMPLGV
jgi:hypothetical protein